MDNASSTWWPLAEACRGVGLGDQLAAVESCQVELNELAQRHRSIVRLRAPGNISWIVSKRGKVYTIGADGVVEVEPDDVESFPYERLDGTTPAIIQKKKLCWMACKRHFSMSFEQKCSVAAIAGAASAGVLRPSRRILRPGGMWWRWRRAPRRASSSNCRMDGLNFGTMSWCSRPRHRCSRVRRAAVLADRRFTIGPHSQSRSPNTLRHTVEFGSQADLEKWCLSHVKLRQGARKPKGQTKDLKNAKDAIKRHGLDKIGLGAIGVID